jgi:hypothetical protein
MTFGQSAATYGGYYPYPAYVYPAPGYAAYPVYVAAITVVRSSPLASRILWARPRGSESNT